MELRLPLNSQKERLYREVEFKMDLSEVELLVARDTQQPGMMASVSCYGKSSLHFIEGTLNQNSYRELLRDKVFPEIQMVMSRFKKQGSGPRCRTEPPLIS